MAALSARWGDAGICLVLLNTQGCCSTQTGGRILGVTPERGSWRAREGGRVPGRQEPALSAQLLLELLDAEPEAPPIRPTQGALVCRQEMIHVHPAAPQQIFHSQRMLPGLKCDH